MSAQENSNPKWCLTVKPATAPERTHSSQHNSLAIKQLILAPNQINKITNKTSLLNSDVLASHSYTLRVLRLCIVLGAFYACIKAENIE